MRYELRGLAFLPGVGKEGRQSTYSAVQELAVSQSHLGFGSGPQWQGLIMFSFSQLTQLADEGLGRLQQMKNELEANLGIDHAALASLTGENLAAGTVWSPIERVTKELDLLHTRVLPGGTLSVELATIGEVSESTSIRFALCRPERSTGLKRAFKVPLSYSFHFVHDIIKLGTEELGMHKAGSVHAIAWRRGCILSSQCCSLFLLGLPNGRPAPRAILKHVTHA